jgi:hypothetical protein
MILQTVAIPCYNSKKIAWLSMEGLCNQQNINHSWELIICEEIQKNLLGESFFRAYTDRLKSVGCEKITYLQPKGWIPLPQKWKMMGEIADKDSKSFVCQDVDDHPSSLRLSLAHENVGIGDYDWLGFRQGYFFSFIYNKIIRYKTNGGFGLSVSMKTKYARTIPHSTLKSGIIGFLYKHVGRQEKNFKNNRVPELYTDALYTDGYNNISKRNGFYRQPHRVFTGSDITIDDLTLSEEVKKKLKALVIKK